MKEEGVGREECLGIKMSVIEEEKEKTKEGKGDREKEYLQNVIIL